MKQLEFTMEMFDLNVRRLRNGNKLRIILETTEDLELEKNLINFRSDNVKVIINLKTDSENICLEKIFEIFDIKCRRLRNGDKLRLIFERMYEKEDEVILVKMRYNDVNIFMEKINTDLPLDDEESDGKDIFQDVEIPGEM